MEQIYTIPVNEAFEMGQEDAGRGCPFCRLLRRLELDELDLILGASMMEPDIRKKTNEKGFCPDHYGKMMKRGKRLPLALILQSHLQE
ncbi:MAG: ABC transporter substrate-binding protein, partial [Clostridia bacterium]|nr:ABC transporter substrate-binding protein [Clostridia bacterium]